MTLPAAKADLTLPSNDDIRALARAIALVSEDLIEAHDFEALTGLDVAAIPNILKDAAMLADVRKAAYALMTSGGAARLEATRHAREAVQVAALIMKDPDMHATNRLNAATFIAKVSGTERPAADDRIAQERHTITINIGGDRPPIRVTSGPPTSAEKNSTEVP